MKSSILLVMLLFLTSCLVKERINRKSPFLEPEIEEPVEETRNEADLPSAIITCEKYCSGINHLRSRINNGYNYLSFPNFGSRGIGRCRGHALLTQKMSILAKFNLGEKACDLNSISCLNFYLRGIDKINKYESFTFPGFANLFEFSSVPRIKEYLYAIVSKTSHRYSAVNSPVENSNYPSEQEKYYYEVRRRTLMGELPYIGIRGNLTGAHAVLAYALDRHYGKEIICVRDPNITPEGREYCSNYFYIENRVVYYKKASTKPEIMRSFKLTSDEDIRSARYKRALQYRCMEESRKASVCK